MCVTFGPRNRYIPFSRGRFEHRGSSSGSLVRFLLKHGMFASEIPARLKNRV